MSGALISTNNPQRAAIAALAQELVGVMMAAGDEAGLGWDDACFAAALAMKARTAMAAQQQDEAQDQLLAQLRDVIEAGLRQEVSARRFGSQAEAEAWAAADGLVVGPVVGRKGRH